MEPLLGKRKADALNDKGDGIDDDKDVDNHDNDGENVMNNEDNNNNDDANSVGSPKEGDEVDPVSVCVQGLQNWIGTKDLFKFCRESFDPAIELDSVFKPKNKAYAFLKFKSEEDKNRFTDQLTNKLKNKIKNRKVKIRGASKKNASFQKGVTWEEVEAQQERKKQKIEVSEQEMKEELAIGVIGRTSSLWQTPYEEQIKIKSDAFREILCRINERAMDALGRDGLRPKWLKYDEVSEDPGGWGKGWWRKGKNPVHYKFGPVCELEKFYPTDLDKINHYRNKVEFTIGESYEEKGKVKVGFNNGNFNKGFMFVESAEKSPLVTKESLIFARKLEELIPKSGVGYFERLNLSHPGFWRNLVVRQSDKTKEILITVVGAKKNLPDDQSFSNILEMLKTEFLAVKLEDGYKVVSLQFLVHDDSSDNIPTDKDPMILWGQDYYNETILGVTFKVHTSSFLQVNTPTCKKLYSLVKDLANVDEETVFLDICSGIGTIGLCMAKNAKKIIGIEMVQAAVDDAKENAKLNSVENVEYVCAKVEDAITEVIKPYAGKCRIVGVVDPPRAGLHASVIKALRTCKGLDSLVYVACSPESIIDNLLGLCLPATKQRKGPALTVTKAFGVDLFPHTPHFEAVFYLQRLYNE